MATMAIGFLIGLTVGLVCEVVRLRQVIANAKRMLDTMRESLTERKSDEPQAHAGTLHQVLDTLLPTVAFVALGPVDHPMRETAQEALRVLGETCGIQVQAKAIGMPSSPTVSPAKPEWKN